MFGLSLKALFTAIPLNLGVIPLSLGFIAQAVNHVDFESLGMGGATIAAIFFFGRASSLEKDVERCCQGQERLRDDNEKLRNELDAARTTIGVLQEKLHAQQNHDR